MSDIQQFLKERVQHIQKLGSCGRLKKSAKNVMLRSAQLGYHYTFDWLGVPIIQIPQDMVAIQDVIWKTKPDLIIETGVARGGSLILSASILQLLNGRGKVLGIDIDIRPHNREVIEAHPLAHRIELLEGSSVAPDTLAQVKTHLPSHPRVMVILDSHHSHAHVLRELELYAPFVTAGCYLVVMDTLVEDMPDDYFPGRPWGKGDNPKTAVHAFLKTTDRFEVDTSIPDHLILTVAPDGYLKCIK